MHLRIGIEPGDQVEKLGLRRIAGELVQPAGDADLFAGEPLVLYVDLAGGIVAHHQHRQPWWTMTC